MRQVVRLHARIETKVRLWKIPLLDGSVGLEIQALYCTCPSYHDVIPVNVAMKASRHSKAEAEWAKQSFNILIQNTDRSKDLCSSNRPHSKVSWPRMSDVQRPSTSTTRHARISPNFHIHLFNITRLSLHSTTEHAATSTLLSLCLSLHLLANLDVDFEELGYAAVEADGFALVEIGFPVVCVYAFGCARLDEAGEN